jgi:hypothetical protein
MKRMLNVKLLIIFSFVFTACSERLSEEVDKKVQAKVAKSSIFIHGAKEKLTASTYKLEKQAELTEKEKEKVFNGVKNSRALIKDYNMDYKKYDLKLIYKVTGEKLLFANNELYKNKEALDTRMKSLIEKRTTSKTCIRRKRSLFGKGMCLRYNTKKKADAATIESSIRKSYENIKTLNAGDDFEVDYRLAVLTESAGGKKNTKVMLEKK